MKSSTTAFCRQHPDRRRSHAASQTTPAVLRAAWRDVNDRLAAAFDALAPEEWLGKHTSVSDEDFAKDPHRNRLSVLLSRTGHAAFHLGQIRLTR